MPKPPDLTGLLARMHSGDAAAADLAMKEVYGELRRLASSYMRRESATHTLQPTALVNEAYLRLVGGPDVHSRKHFYALAAQAMRRVLVDHARHKHSIKRGRGLVQVTLDDIPGLQALNVDILALDEALSELSAIDTRAAQVVELRFFGGHTDKEVCELLGENLAAIRRDWEFARSWLWRRLSS